MVGIGTGGGCPPSPPSMIPEPDPPAALRRGLRALRRGLSASQQRDHARALTRRLGRHQAFLRARRIGIYWPTDGEIDPRPLLHLTQARRKIWQLPVLCPHPHPRLWFLAYRPGDSMRLNRFGIPEPARRNRRLRFAWTLDLLLVPLVGFDADCNRLGMGGGYYDRTLSYLAHRQHWRRPRLIGIAHECQCVAQLPVRPWDVPLDLVITERRVYRRGPAG
jgi:5-formyltetrahydrofolate cyclo-ligase